MNSSSQQEKLRRLWAMKNANHPIHHDSFESELRALSQSRSSICPQHSRLLNPAGQWKPSYTEEKDPRNELYEQLYPRSSHFNNFPPEMTPMDFATWQLHQLLRQKGGLDNGFEALLSPPATASSSRSTVFSCNSAPPFLNQCSSPVPSEEFDRHFGSFEAPSNFKFNSSPTGCDNLNNGFFAKDGRIYDRGTIYTAEDVHAVVKNNRGVCKKRIVSNKVFVGGISHAINRETINSFFGKFGTVFVDWPVKQRTTPRGKAIPVSSYSYLFLVYSEEESVLKLMKACIKPSDNEFYVYVPGCSNVKIQIRPWFINNAFYIADKALHTKIIDIHRTVFVGGLPRIVTAAEIAQMFSIFGVVLLVTIDIDQDYGYPKGAARVTFAEDLAFNAALERKLLKFENIDSSKTVIEIKPYIMEDIGCDQCGGLWYNPFRAIYELLEISKKEKKPTHQNYWSFNDSEDLLSKIDRFEDPEFTRRNELDAGTMEVEQGARKFVELAKSFNLDKPQIVNVGGTDYQLGPDLWYQFLPEPVTNLGNDGCSQDQKIERFLPMKKEVVYSNKSAYCKDRPCRQYYCPSCANKFHSGPQQHVLLPSGKPERRPRKDKNMYMVNLNV